MKLIWYGTASLGVSTAQTRLLVDPFIPLPGSAAPDYSRDYAAYGSVLVTHGHLDHIFSIPRILWEYTPRIYCTSTPAELLEDEGAGIIRTIYPASHVSIGDITVQIYQSRHVKYDAGVLRRTVFSKRFFQNLGKAFSLGRLNRQYRENGETVAYELQAEGRRLFILGSLALDPLTVYPQGMDCLVLPYQGCSELRECAKEIIERLKPKKVFLDHFDDTFPPVSSAIDTSEIETYCTEQGIPAIRPEYGAEYTV